MTNFLKQRKTWKGSTKIKSSKCAKIMSLKWREDVRTIETNKMQTLVVSMNFSNKKMRNKESLKRDLMN